MITTFPAALSPQHWPFDLGWLPQSAYLVGGCVRDALQDRTSAYLDLDFVLPEQPMEIAKAIARHYQAGFVCLDAERQIARVVFPDSTADFALQVGDSLTEDLQRRDFTVNAIAYHPHTHQIIDPLDGQRDLRHKCMRMIAAQNLREDPLRLLRAYRQASQLGFAIDPETHATIRQLAPQLQQIAAERIRVELGYLLSDPEGTPWLQTLAADGLLNLWFPEATLASIERVAAVDRIVADWVEQWPSMAAVLDQPLNDRAQGSEATQRTLRTAVKLMALLSSDPSQTKRTLTNLKYARTEITVVLTVLQEWLRLSPVHNWGQLVRADQYYLFRYTGGSFPAFALWLRVMGVSAQAVRPLILEYLNPESGVAHPEPLMTGKALMAALNLAPGPQIGRLLKQLDRAQAEGKIQSRDAAIALAKTLISSP